MNQNHGGADRVLSEREYCALLGIGASTAHRQRASGTGPTYVQISARRIGYRVSDVRKWLDEHARGHSLDHASKRGA